MEANQSCHSFAPNRFPAGIADQPRNWRVRTQATSDGQDWDGIVRLFVAHREGSGPARPLVDIGPLPEAKGLSLDGAVMPQLQKVIAERERAGDLRRAGVGLTRTMLLRGPPGIGKTMTARWLALGAW
jgi:hypothetical protein